MDAVTRLSTISLRKMLSKYRTVLKLHHQNLPFYLRDVCDDTARKEFGIAKLYLDNEDIPDFITKYV